MPRKCFFIPYLLGIFVVYPLNLHILAARSLITPDSSAGRSASLELRAAIGLSMRLAKRISLGAIS